MKRGTFLQQGPHEFEEDVEDASMCLCGVPAIGHTVVEPTADGSEGL